MSTLPHHALVEIHTPPSSISRGFRAGCTLGCCHGTTWHPSRADAEEEARVLVELQENGPSDAELEVAWNGPDAHEAHRAAWALAQGIESGEVA